MSLQFIDEHCTVISAPRDRVWQQLGSALGPTRGRRLAAQFLGTLPREAAGKALAEGSSLPGFAVEDAVPEERVVFTGRHRFAEYALVVTLTGPPDRTRLCARTHADFPGIHGRLYRTLVIGSGAHRVLIKRLLRHLRRASEASAAHLPD